MNTWGFQCNVFRYIAAVIVLVMSPFIKPSLVLDSFPTSGTGSPWKSFAPDLNHHPLLRGIPVHFGGERY